MSSNSDVEVQQVRLPKGCFPRRRKWCLNCDEGIQRGFFCSLECANTHFLVIKLEQSLEFQFPEQYEIRRQEAIRRILEQRK